MFGNNSFTNTSFGGATFGSGFGATPTLGAFGSTTQPAAQPTGPIGTTIRFVPPSGSESVQKAGAGGPSQVTTRHQNISAMKEYESKSNDELRMEDYAANRKVGTSLFGAQPQQTSSLFGAQNQNQTTSLFGQAKTDANTSNIFGSSMNKPANPLASTSTSAFGSSPFGNIQQPASTQTSLFGSQPQQNTSIFGATNQQNTSQPTTSLFGAQTQPSTNLFGASTQQPSTNLFGQQKTDTNLNNTSGNIFGGFNKPTNPLAPTSQPSAFGLSPFGSIQTSASQPGTSLFGTQPQQTSSLFGAQNQNQTTSLFGQAKTDANTSNIFGSGLNKPANPLASTSTSAFGSSPFGNIQQPSTSQTSLFGSQPQQNTSIFGATNQQNTSQPTTSLFGAQPQPSTNLFGASTQQPSTNLFGQQKTDTNLNNTSGNIFGGFNKPANPLAPTSQPSAFGSSPFGSIQTSTSQPGTSLFGSQPQQTTSLFGAQNQNQTTSLFGQVKTDANASNIFGSSLNKPANPLAASTSTSAFGTSSFGALQQPSTSQTSLFGSQPQQNTSLFGASSQPAQVNNTQTSPQSPDLILNRLKTLPYGETSILLNDTASSSPGLGSLKFTTDPKTISQYKMNARTNVKLNKSTSVNKARANSILFDGLDDNTNDDLRCAIDVFVQKKNIKKLDLKPSSYMAEGDAERANGSPLFEQSHSSLQSRSLRENTINRNSTPLTRRVHYADNTFPGGHPATDNSFATNLSSHANSSDVSSLHNVNSSNNSHYTGTPPSRIYPPLKSGVTNTRPDYKLRPSLEEMERCYNSDNDTCIIDSLFIERPNYGSIFFDAPLNVKGLNIDEIVQLRRKEVIVYPDDENKPPVGQGLNRPAIVTLHQVWPIDKSNNEVIKDIDRLNLMRYPEKIESITVDKGARFIEYRPETGSWVFAVKHFSKYGITDDDEELPSSTSASSSQVQRQQHVSFQNNTQPQSMPPPPTPANPIAAMQTSSYTDRPRSSQPIGEVTPVNQSKSSYSESRYMKAFQKETPMFVNDIEHQSPKGPTRDIASTPVSNQEVRTPLQQYKMSVKNSIKLPNVATSPNGIKSSNSVLFDSISDVSNYSIRHALDELFEEDGDYNPRKSESKRSLTVHGTKRLALQNTSPNISITSFDRPITTGAVVPKQQRIRDLKLKPDLYAAHNKLYRDIASVCVSGSPKVRFMNGSRKFCLIKGDSVIINEVKLVPTDEQGSLPDTTKEKFEAFLNNHSLVTSMNTNPILAPYIETDDYIPIASSHDLLFALYGNLSSKTPYAKQDERLTRVIDWLSKLNRTLPAPDNLYSKIIYYMSCNQYDLASELAIENDHPRLALMVATLNINKELIFEQLSSWRLGTADQYIDQELLKIYILLSGLTEWKLSNDSVIYCLKGLKWTQQLCLLIMHVTSYTTEPEKHGFHLLPFYMKRLDTNTNDVNYHILARHNPSSILSAADSLTEEWFLLESLKSFNVINTESECANADIIHCNLAAQLASIDLRWACFVALHIINNEVRNQVLTQCLDQNYEQLKEFKADAGKSVSPISIESWLIEKLKMPKQFIDNSKSLTAAKSEVSV